MPGAKHDYHLSILEHHLDSFSHVNNAAYLQILEEARWDIVTRNGYGLDQVRERQIGPTIVEIRLRFLRELRNRQRITVRSWLESYSGKIGTFVQQIQDAADEGLCCEAELKIGLFDLRARKLVRPTPEWLAALGLAPGDLADGA